MSDFIICPICGERLSATADMDLHNARAIDLGLHPYTNHLNEYGDVNLDQSCQHYQVYRD